MNWHDIYVTSLKKKNNNTKNVIHYAKRINIDSPSAVSGLWSCPLEIVKCSNLNTLKAFRVVNFCH